MTNIEKVIKKRLIELDKNQKWLIDEVKNATGLYFDRSYLCKIFLGKNSNPKILKAIFNILDIPSGLDTDECET